ncbi:hypothetical protein JJQ72_13505 [Paenibacillus sp. F411]|uniref:hypothetical protein n=1 Tax=unclassified Paenibacillus TaxID=185978 RepID=UPI001AAF2E86|nr:hypothetical protein [Paenibacillus sp. F411]MBO2944989.1 hypothetical protein [Paenibacillus sp. F411]
MRRTFGFSLLNLKMLLFEKVAFVWTVIFPLFIALVMQRGVLDSTSSNLDMMKYMFWFWAFIIISTFLNGIGLQSARLKESGLLKTYTLIAGSKYPIIFGIVLTQVAFAILSLMIFTTILTLIYDIFSFKLLILMLITVFISMPLAFAAFGIALLPVQVSSVSTLLNILMYPVFLIAINVDLKHIGFLEFFNPFTFIYEISLNMGVLFGWFQHEVLYVPLSISFLFFGIVGYISSKKLNLISVLQR